MVRTSKVILQVLLENILYLVSISEVISGLAWNTARIKRTQIQLSEKMARILSYMVILTTCSKLEILYQLTYSAYKKECLLRKATFRHPRKRPLRNRMPKGKWMTENWREKCWVSCWEQSKKRRIHNVTQPSISFLITLYRSGQNKENEQHCQRMGE